MTDYKGLIEFIAKRLVTSPDAVQVSSTEKEEGHQVVRIRVAPEDVGRVIGKRGATINAMRQVARAAATKEGLRGDVDVEEE